MFSSFMNTIKRIFNQKDTAAPEQEYSSQQLLAWAQGCMLEGLPDKFFEARLTCSQLLLEKGHREVKVTYSFKLYADSDYERFYPADDLYPAHCIEKILKQEVWSEAVLIFTPEGGKFSWD